MAKLKSLVNGTQKQSTPQAEIDQFWNRRFNITSFLFDKQLAFVEDPEPFKVAVCSRRAGKTVSCAAHLIHTAVNNPGSLNLYITISSKNAKRIIWRDLLSINRQFKLGGLTDETELSITFRNDSTIYITGCKDESSLENFRGLPIKLCYIDECQSFRPYIEELIDDVIGPGLIDYNGTLCLIGTPGPLPTGFFYKCSVESEVWSKHHWTFFDNPHIPIKSGKTHQHALERELKRRGVTPEHPSIQREWFGRWQLDSESLLIKYNKELNHYQTLPTLSSPQKWSYILGIDVGFNDADALAVLAYNDVSPDTYLVEEQVTTKQGLTELVQQVEDMRKRYDISKIVMDMGGLGKKMGEEMIRRHGIPVEAADKARKMENVEFLNDALRTNRFRAKAASKFAEESYLVEIDRAKSRPDKIVVSDRFHSDIIDAVLYAFKCSPAYAYVPDKPKIIKGSKQWADQQVDEMFEATMNGLQQEAMDAKILNGDFS